MRRMRIRLLGICWGEAADKLLLPRGRRGAASRTALQRQVMLPAAKLLLAWNVSRPSGVSPCTSRSTHPLCQQGKEAGHTRLSDPAVSGGPGPDHRAGAAAAQVQGWMAAQVQGSMAAQASSPGPAPPAHPPQAHHQALQQAGRPRGACRAGRRAATWDLPLGGRQHSA